MLAFARRQDLKPERSTCTQLVAAWPSCCSARSGRRSSVEIAIARRPAAGRDRSRTSSKLALLNLAVNARDAMHGRRRDHHRGATRDASARQRGAARAGTLCLPVGDRHRRGHGRGDARSAPPSRSSPPRASARAPGLGLSMVHGLAEQSGGTLLLKSRPGEGTTAEIWLPAHGPRRRRRRRAAAPQPRRRPMPARRLTILAVDDDALILMNTVAMLEDLGHRSSRRIRGKRGARRCWTEDEHRPAWSPTMRCRSMTGAQLGDRGSVALLPACRSSSRPATPNCPPARKST